jgi:metal-responsive CopG/Arc/MetJ family transcriptional regulator
MATKRADQRKLQTSVTMDQSLYNAVRDVAHLLGVSNSEVVVTAITEYLKAHYPDRAADAGL